MSRALVLVLFASWGCASSMSSDAGSQPLPPRDASADVYPPDASCSATTPAFTALVTDLSLIEHIVPLGSVAGGEIKDHVFFGVKGSAVDVPVSAPVAADLVSVARYQEGSIAEQFLLEFRVDCAVSFRFDHVSSVSDRIRAVAPATIGTGSGTSPVTQSLHVEAGELLGRTTVHSWDFGVVDTRHTNVFAEPSRYSQPGFVSRRVNAVCPFEFADATSLATYRALWGGNGGAGTCTECGSASQDAVGHLAGMWFIDPVASGLLTRHFALGSFCDHTAVRVDGLSVGTITTPSGPDPSTVTEACYVDPMSQSFAWLKLASDKVLDVATGTGPCPSTFPTTGLERWVR
jgi:hypothetical protein